MKRSLSVFLSALPFLIVLGLLYAAFFIKPSVDGAAIPPPVMARNDAVYGMSTPDAGATLWAAGSSGKIWISRDKGMHWSIQATPVADTLQDISNWDLQRAVAVGNDGVILVTGDGGKAWTRVAAPRSPIANKLIRVRTYPGGEAWAVGEAGTALRSADYGKHWVRMTPDEDSGWNDVSKQGSQVILAGEFGRLRMSADDGATWKDVDSPVKSSLMALAFKDAAEGTAVGLDGVVLATTDGGRKWVRQATASAAHLFDVIWDGRQWAATGNHGVLLTTRPDSPQWTATTVSATDRTWHTRILALYGQYLWAGQNIRLVPRPAS
jgi:photosystem II stability/assembly factor-like uncharacterized protein